MQNLCSLSFQFSKVKKGVGVVKNFSKISERQKGVTITRYSRVISLFRSDDPGFRTFKLTDSIYEDDDATLPITKNQP